jgi:hypothetical protein
MLRFLVTKTVVQERILLVAVQNLYTHYLSIEMLLCMVQLLTGILCDLDGIFTITPNCLLLRANGNIAYINGHG